MLAKFIQSIDAKFIEVRRCKLQRCEPQGHGFKDDANKVRAPRARLLRYSYLGANSTNHEGTKKAQDIKKQGQLATQGAGALHI